MNPCVLAITQNPQRSHKKHKAKTYIIISIENVKSKMELINWNTNNLKVS